MPPELPSPNQSRMERPVAGETARSGSDSKLRWQIMIAACGLAMTLFLALFGYHVSNVAELRTELKAHASLPIHPGAAEKLAAVNAEVKEIERRVSSIEGKSADFVTRRELDAALAPLQKQLDRIEGKIDDALARSQPGRQR